MNWINNMNCCHVAFAGLVAWTINSVIQHIRIVKVETKEKKLEIRTKELEKKNGKELKKIEELEKTRQEDRKNITDLQKEVRELKRGRRN